MANAIKTVMTYNLNGSTKDFNIPFEYLARKFITVTLIGKDRKVLVLNQDYRFTTKTTITTTRAWAVADGYTSIEVRRFTSATDRLVDFADGSILRAYDLNISQVQTLHVAEEARDLTADTIGVNNDGNLDARGRRIVNVANAVDRGDAVSLGQLQDLSTGAYQSYQNALAQAQEATRQQQEATRQQGIATQQASASAGSASAAKTSETNAASSNTAAGAARDLAQRWASAARDSVVANGLFSAYHWALNAADYAATALGYRDTTKGYMDAAAGSATTATTQATRAKTEADKLGNMNAFASAVQSVDATTYAVRMKGNFQVGDFYAAGINGTAMIVNGWSNFNGPMTVVNGSGQWLTVGNPNASETSNGATQGNGVRINNRGNQFTDLYTYESTGNYTSLTMHVVGGSNNDAFFEFRANKWAIFPNFQTTGQMNSIGDFRCNTTVYVGTGSTRIAQDGNIWGTRWNSSGEWLVDWINRVSVGNVYLGSQWYQHYGQTYVNWAAGGGSVVTGIEQKTGNGDSWIETVYLRPVWIVFNNGSSRVVAST